jgi:polyphosphate kinase 2
MLFFVFFVWFVVAKALRPSDAKSVKKCKKWFKSFSPLSAVRTQGNHFLIFSAFFAVGGERSFTARKILVIHPQMAILNEEIHNHDHRSFDLQKPSRGTMSKKEKHDKKETPHTADEPISAHPAAQGQGVALDNDTYAKELSRLQVEMVKLQEWIRFKGLKVVVIFEGRDAAGKGGVIKRITESLNPRICRVVALPAPTEREKSQWYFQRYVQHLPAAGEMVLFDRSWYNRAGVERVMGFCTQDEYSEFLRSVPEFERMLVRSGIILIKYWFSVSNDEQEKRFQARIDDPTKRWKLSPMDLQSRARWVEYSRAKDEMFSHTDIKQAPWYVVNADDKMCARLNCISHLLSLIPFEDLTPEPVVLPERLPAHGYVRPPITDQTFVPEKFRPFGKKDDKND